MLGKIWYGLVCLFVAVMFLGAIARCTGITYKSPDYTYDISKYDSVSDKELFELDRKAYTERIRRFDAVFRPKINNESLGEQVKRKTDRYYQRITGGSIRNHKTFDYEPKAPFYEPQRSVRCSSVSDMTNMRNLEREMLNTYLMRRNLKDEYQGDERALEEIDQMSCRGLYKNTFSVSQ
jgi:hypothetical protein